jgi:aerobic-type carbon monoxide dehydrogenase small subunit (CoxS/CutS family)
MAERGKGLPPSQLLDITMEINHQMWSGQITAELTLLEFIREQQGLTGTKRSCESEVCGACTVLVDDRAVSSCTYLAVEALGRRVLTIEGLERDGQLDPLQKAFMRHEGFQCGFCTSGVIMCSKALLLENASPTKREVADYLRGNICRCGAYLEILAAVLEAAEMQPLSREG